MRPFFKLFLRKSLSRAISRSEAYRMIRRRAIEAGIFAPVLLSFVPGYRDYGLSREQGNSGDRPEDCGARKARARRSCTIETRTSLRWMRLRRFRSSKQIPQPPCNHYV